MQARRNRFHARSIHFITLDFTRQPTVNKDDDWISYSARLTHTLAQFTQGCNFRFSVKNSCYFKALLKIGTKSLTCFIDSLRIGQSTNIFQSDRIRKSQHFWQSLLGNQSLMPNYFQGLHPCCSKRGLMFFLSFNSKH